MDRIMSEFDVLNMKPACLHLRHKLMWVDSRQQTPGMVDDSSDTRIFFCMRSHEQLGPDGVAVGPKRCTPERTCYCKA